MNSLQLILDNIFYIIGGLFLVIIVLYLILNRFKQKPDPVLEAFFEKYNLDLDNSEETECKMRDIADINSSYPDEDKRIAQALLRIKNQLNSSNN